MDAASFFALSVVLGQALPGALEDAMLLSERARMTTEDVSAHALAGRVLRNPDLKPPDAGSGPPTWYEHRRRAPTHPTWPFFEEFEDD